ncbi:MAG: hypothetical protein ACYTX0_32645 [Nostoc sp.]
MVYFILIQVRQYLDAFALRGVRLSRCSSKQWATPIFPQRLVIFTYAPVIVVLYICHGFKYRRAMATTYILAIAFNHHLPSV